RGPRRPPVAHRDGALGGARSDAQGVALRVTSGAVPAPRCVPWRVMVGPRADGRGRLRVALLALVLVALLAPAADAANGPSAVIRRSAHGIPHIVSSSWEGIGYGYGYAFAQDDICPMADDYVTV